MAHVHLLDCTFRDGGYYNQWVFGPKLVSRYLRAMQGARIDALEIGFRFLPQPGFLGPFAYASDDLLADLPLPKGVTIAVMVNAKELLGYPDGPDAAVDFLFGPAQTSPVELVRIAAHFTELPGCRAIASRIKRKGYDVAVNIMQAGGRTPEELSAAAASIADWGIDILYFADSLGNMNAEMVSSAVKAFQKGWKGPIGVHTHNNMGQALANCRAAIQAGAEWIDGTVTGMGRGAGNANTEHLLVELNQDAPGQYPFEEVSALALEDFEPLRKQYGWGPSLLYFLSARHGIHPTYVQEMLGKGQYDAAHLIAAMEFLKESDARGFSRQKLDAILSSHGNGKGAWSARDWASNKTVLLVAPGPGTAAHLDALCRFAEREKPVVVSLNVNSSFPAERVTAYAACHKSCIVLDAEKYRSFGKPIVAPIGAVPEKVRQGLKSRILDFGMEITPGAFSVRHDGCGVPASVVAAYALGLAEAAGARNILLAGFDGYGPSDPRQSEMNQILRVFRARPTAPPVLAVTPTCYDVPQGSIYSPDLLGRANCHA